jgi:pimeloyl-ACP methyl ester carboxylesterase
LQAAGHEVFTPTLTGSGERVHLASPEIDLETHVLDIVNVLHYENLHDVILVGISGGGMAITGAAERVPERIGHLIYLDAFAPQDGQSLGDLLGPEMLAAFEQAAQAYGDGWRVPHDPPDADRRTDLLLKPVQQALAVNNPDAARLKRTFVLFTGKAADDWLTPVFGRIAARVREDTGWNYYERPFEHWPVLEKPREVASLLLELG